jgi:hypothetical protein
MSELDKDLRWTDKLGEAARIEEEWQEKLRNG